MDNWNFRDLGTDRPGAMNRLPVRNSTPLSPQGSIYSWRLDQIQNNLGKHCGSMNVEELLMNMYTAEEIQGMVSTNGVNEGLQRQSSITLPRILSQKTVDEVCKYITEEEEHINNDGGRTNIPQIQRQQTLGDITLEEFLIRAGATGSNNNGGFIGPSSGNLTTSSSDSFEKKPMVSDLMNNIVPRSRNQVQQLYGANLHPNVNGFGSTYQPQQQQQQQQNQMQPQQQQQQNQMQPQQPVMSNPHGYGYGHGTQLAFTSGQLKTHGIRDSFMGIGDQSHQENNISFVPSVATVPGGAMSVDTCSPITPFPLLDGIRKNNVGSSLVSPFPYSINGSNSVRDRKNYSCIAVDKKLVEKTQRRKIKNRESAARSRARKQAQTMELEAELEMLRKQNQELLRKQAETSKMQTNLQVKGMVNRPEKQLRRTKSDIY